MAKSFVSDDRSQPGERVVGNVAVSQAPPHPDHRLLGDVGGVVRAGDAARLTETLLRQVVPVETGNAEI